MAVSGARIRAIRRALRLSASDFADWFGVRERAVHRWESDERRMNWYHERRLAQLLMEPWVRERLRQVGLGPDEAA